MVEFSGFLLTLFMEEVIGFIGTHMVQFSGASSAIDYRMACRLALHVNAKTSFQNLSSITALHCLLPRTSDDLKLHIDSHVRSLTSNYGHNQNFNRD